MIVTPKSKPCIAAKVKPSNGLQAWTLDEFMAADLSSPDALREEAIMFQELVNELVEKERKKGCKKERLLVKR